MGYDVPGKKNCGNFFQHAFSDKAVRYEGGSSGFL